MRKMKMMRMGKVVQSQIFVNKSTCFYSPPFFLEANGDVDEGEDDDEDDEEGSEEEDGDDVGLSYLQKSGLEVLSML